MTYSMLHKVGIENEDLFELKAWLEEMRQERDRVSLQKATGFGSFPKPRSDLERILDIRLAIFEKIMRQLP